jgi:curved DNA-binding protein CbpA
MRPQKRYYQALGVAKDATPAEVKRAYRALAKQLHPDRMRDPELARKAEERLKEINAAWNEYRALLKQRTNGSAHNPSKRQAGAQARRSAHPAGEPDDDSFSAGHQDAPRPHRRTGHASRERYRAERARQVRERAERERRARERTEQVRREREGADYERHLREREARLRLIEIALASLAILLGVGFVLFVAWVLVRSFR